MKARPGLTDRSHALELARARQLRCSPFLRGSATSLVADVHGAEINGAETGEQNRSDLHAVHRKKFLNVRMVRAMQFRHRTEVDRPAIVQEHDAIRHQPHQVKIVCHYNRGEISAAPSAAASASPRLVAHDRIHHRGGFIVEDALGLCCQRPRDRDGALVAGGKVGRVWRRRTPEVDHFQQPSHHFFPILGVVIVAQLRARTGYSRPTVIESNSAPDWNTIVTFFRIAPQSHSRSMGNIGVRRR